jgi:hypothetical protein
MLDTLDAALFDPASGNAHFFSGDRYVEYAPGRGCVPLADGRLVRRLGVDGWTQLPEALRGGIDAAMFYPPDGVTYFVRGDRYIEYSATAVAPLRRLGIDGWTHLPAELHAGIDAAFYCRVHGCAYWFRGDRYAGPDGKLRSLSDGWGLAAFTAIDAALDYPPNNRIYFFHGRDYVRADPETGVEPHYPARVGAPYGRGLVAGKGGGWLGLSRLVAGPLVGPVAATTATLWLWTLDLDTVARLRLVVAGQVHTPIVRDLVDPGLRETVDRIHAGSQIVALELAGLVPGQDHAIELTVDDRVLDRVALRTAQAPASHGRVELVIGSCADMSTHRDVPVFARMAERGADAAILLGDNCYYINLFGSSSNHLLRGGWFRADWDDPRRMLLRQLAARNHPDFAAVARTTSFHAIWDDHDFAYNNAAGHDAIAWVGRQLSASIFRALWAGAYVDDHAIYHSFRNGPVEVFVTDNRYDKDLRRQQMLGPAQLAWLLEGLAASDAPVKVIAVGSQFLYRRKHESFHTDAPGERAAILDAVERAGGRVLVISGDVHFSELVRAPAYAATPTLLEFTSSSIRTGEVGEPTPEWEPGTQLWAVQADAFGVVAIDVRAPDEGTITLEARDDRGELLRRTVWNLADGALA